MFELVHFKVLYIGLGFLSGFSVKSAILELVDLKMLYIGLRWISVRFQCEKWCV